MSGEQTGGGALLLIIECDPYVRKLERFFLEDAGFRVEFVEDGLIGLKRAREILPDILVTEILLPRVDGLSVVRALRAEPATKGMALLVFSVLAAEKQAREAGADAFLLKPVDDGVLLTTVKDLIAQRSKEVRLK
jgi:CheY-like chemotaxis protein